MEIRKCSGVYGIYVDGELVYVGSTTRTFEVRFIEHKKRMMSDCKEQPLLYEYLRKKYAEGSKITLKPLVIVEDLWIRGKGISKRDVKIMELSFINLFKPICNVEGITMPFTVPYKEN